MSDLLFISGAIFVIGLCFAAMIGFLIYSLRELHEEPEVPSWLKWGLTSVVVGFGLMLLGVALKILENL